MTRWWFAQSTWTTTTLSRQDLPLLWPDSILCSLRELRHFPVALSWPDNGCFHSTRRLRRPRRGQLWPDDAFGIPRGLRHLPQVISWSDNSSGSPRGLGLHRHDQSEPGNLFVPDDVIFSLDDELECDSYTRCGHCIVCARCLNHLLRISRIPRCGVCWKNPFLGGKS